MSDGPIQIQRDNVDVFPPVPPELPPWYVAPEPRRRQDWRVALVVGSFLFVGFSVIGALAYQILFADVLNPTPQQTFVRALAAFLAVVSALAASVWLFGRALAPWLIKQAGGVTMTIPQVARLDAQLLLERQLDAQVTYAARQFPHLSGSLTVTNSQPKPQAAQEQAILALAEPLQAVPPAEWLGWLDKQPHIILAAETGGGKSTTAKAILAPRLAAGEDVFVIDPHSSAWFALPSVGGGEAWPTVAAAMREVVNEYADRLKERDAHLRRTGAELPKEHFPRLTVLLDEANNTRAALDSGKRGECTPWRSFVQVLGSGARKVHISIILLAQSANVEDLNISGAMRENFCRIALDSSAARKLITAEEPDRARREQLYEALAGREFPAVCEWRSRVYLLDRTGLDQVTEPANTRARAWRRWEYNTPAVQHADVLTLLRRAEAKGWTRDQTRATLAQRGIQFENRLWTVAAEMNRRPASQRAQTPA